MRMRMENRDYVPDGIGGFERLPQEKRLLHQALFLLSARRGKFAPLPEVGSRLYLLHREKPSAWEASAAAYAQEALSPMGIRVKKAAVKRIDEGLAVTITAEYQGKEQSLEAVIS